MFHIKGHHSGRVSPGRCVPALRGGEENSIGPVRRQAPRTERPVGQRGVGRDQLAVLGLLDPERGKPQARYGLAQLAPQETLGAMALEGVYADNLRSDHRSLALGKPRCLRPDRQGRNCLILRGERRLWGEITPASVHAQVLLKARRWVRCRERKVISDLTSWEESPACPV